MPRHVLLTSGLVLLFSGVLAAQDPAAPAPERVSLARQVLTAMGAEKLFITGVESALPNQRRLQPNIPAIFWDSIAVQMNRRAPEVIDSLAPVYAGLFSTPQLNDLLSFYQSATGRRLVELQGELSSTSGAIGERWGARVALDLMQQLLDQGITFGDD